MRLLRLEKIPKHSTLYLIILAFVGWGGLFIPDAYSETKGHSFNGYFTLEYDVTNKDASGKSGTFDLHNFNFISKYHVSHIDTKWWTNIMSQPKTY